MKILAKSIIYIFCCVFLLSGCARIFSAKNQKLTFVSATPGATIKYADDSIGTGTAIKKINKNGFFQTVSVEKQGYCTKNYAFQLHSLSPTAAFAALDVASVIFFPFVVTYDLLAPRAHKFKKQQNIPELLPLTQRKENNKYLWVENTSFDIKASDIHIVHSHNLSSFSRNSTLTVEQKKKKKTKKSDKNQDIKIDNTIFSDLLNATLADINFVDTSQKIFASHNNSMYLDASIKKVTLHQVKGKHQKAANCYANWLVAIKMEIEWKVLDYYKQPIYTVRTSKISDLFTIDFNVAGHGQVYTPQVYNVYNTAVKKSIANNLGYALADVLSELNSKNMLTISGAKADTSAIIILPRPSAGSDSTRMNEMLKSSVSVKVDEGHGSGVIVSEDGYIVTNYHVVAGTKTVEVIFNDDTKATARVIRTNSNADLALLKVEKTGLRPLAITESKSADVGIDVWAIGTPRSLELGQSVSKGIISGIRKANDLTYLQIDVKVSPGNSGGALINRKGDVLGLVSSKLIGKGIEGVGFALLSSEILTGLKLQYK